MQLGHIHGDSSSLSEDVIFEGILSKPLQQRVKLLLNHLFTSFGSLSVDAKSSLGNILEFLSFKSEKAEIAYSSTTLVKLRTF